MKDYLFAYGSLKSGCAPPEIAETIGKMEYAGGGFVFGRLYDLGEYSGAVLDDSTDKKIYGCVYQLPQDFDVLTDLDEYEGILQHQPESNMFVRKRTKIILESGEKIEGWIYQYNRDIKSAALIENGNWIPK